MRKEWAAWAAPYRANILYEPNTPNQRKLQMQTILISRALPIILAFGLTVMPQTASAQTQQQADDAKANAITVRNITMAEIAGVAAQLAIVTGDDNWYTLAATAQDNPNLNASEKAYANTLAGQCQSLWDNAQSNRDAGDTSMNSGDTNMNGGDYFYGIHIWSVAFGKYNSGYDCYQAANGSYNTTAYNYDQIHIKLGTLHTYATF